MTALREAVILPLSFLLVVLIAALRPGTAPPIVPPTLGALVSAVAVLALLVRSGAVDPSQLMHSSRSALANLNGLTVLLCTVVASAQVITMVVPESGLPALVAWIVLLSLLLQAFAIGPDRVRLLRGLAVTFGAAFVLKYLILASVSAPTESRVGRAMQLLFEGLTLGTMTQRPPSSSEGYLAFVAILLYLITLAFLPAASWHMTRVRRGNAPLETTLIADR